MGNLSIIFKRELLSYFATPLAYIFIVIFITKRKCLSLRLWWFLCQRSSRPVAVFCLSSFFVFVHGAGHCNDHVGGRKKNWNN